MRALSLILAALCLASLCSHAQTDWRLLVRGQEVPFSDGRLSHGMLYVSPTDGSLANAARLLGGEASYDPSDRRLTVAKGGHSASLSPSGFFMDGKEYRTTVPVYLNDGGSFFSLNGVAKALGASLVSDSGQTAWYMDPFIRNVWLEAENDGYLVHIDASGPVDPEVSHVANPDRIVVDVPFAALAPNAPDPSVPSPGTPAGGWIKEARLAQFQSKPNIVRLVITASRSDLNWTAQTDSGRAHYILSLGPEPPPVNPFSESEETVSSQLPATLTEVTFQSENGNAEKGNAEKGNGPEKFTMEFQLSGNTAYEWHHLKPPDNRVFIDLKNVVLGNLGPFQYDSSLVSDVRVSQFQYQPVPIVRVALSLKDDCGVEVANTADGFNLIIHSPAGENSQVASGTGESGSTGGPAPRPGAPAATLPVHPNGIVIALDPGHGGSDPGARANGLVEKEVTLDIAEKLRALLATEGYKVVMTRDSDRDVLGYHGSAKAELQSRVNVADGSKAALFMSIHINSSTASWPQGTQTHWYKAIDLPLANIVEKHLDQESGFEDRGVLRNRFYVLRHSGIPSVLVELGFLSNSADASKLNSEGYREKLAQALCDGIVDYTGAKQSAHVPTR